MYPATSTNTKSNSKLNRYVVNDIMEASPKQLLIKTFDLALLNCRKKDMIRTNRAIQSLIDALSFENEDVSLVSNGLLRLYQYCQDQMRKGNHAMVEKILGELKETWIKVFTDQQV